MRHFPEKIVVPHAKRLRPSRTCVCCAAAGKLKTEIERGQRRKSFDMVGNRPISAYNVRWHYVSFPVLSSTTPEVTLPRPTMIGAPPAQPRKTTPTTMMSELEGETEKGAILLK